MGGGSQQYIVSRLASIGIPRKVKLIVLLLNFKLSLPTKIKQREIIVVHFIMLINHNLERLLVITIATAESSLINWGGGGFI